MDYMKELNAFRNWLLMNDLTTSGIALWHTLMSINNMTGWKEHFNAPNSTVQRLTGLSKQGLVDARKVLIDNNLIEYQKGKKNKAPVYKIISLVNSVDQSLDQIVDQSVDQQLDLPAYQQLDHTYTRQDKTNSNGHEGSIDPDPFDEFWSHYPNKKKRQEAEKKFNMRLKHKNPEERATAEEMILGAKNYKKQLEKDGTEKRFMQHPTTFLNQRSFDDYQTLKSEQKSGNGYLYWNEYESDSIDSPFIEQGMIVRDE
ncbi:hypothetical protein [Natribacillus halophilus]|uniref:Uncharacterized protein n=1 Tax=Natribacillus halophilus TaxID=549003 RepID=A0A1G8RW95_9BACI|nr:hypothetical protein [Natribacillus halophilus]SDJ20640.1 hypothetical protein SAMN04488123_12055 [Natribacillus halophilus]